ncbi:lipopolysaccharide biosynthesis protein [Pelagibacterium sediminicola]|uniref:lipopolysaccharide biosynthesis protein n=1 Tax=Pelagibacterium sediminicola TaxID=2248761 RepID=UPI000E30E980|nr:lipopolysaccharide biosynthesis protein [Pelagibacterium sediminicola]
MSTWLETGSALAARLYRGSRQPRWVMASQMVTSGANFATTLIVVTCLGLEAFGQFSLCFILMMIARNFLVGLVLAPMSAIAPRLGRRALAGYRGFLAANTLVFSLGSSLLLYALATPLGVMLDASWLPQLALAMALANFTANGADFFHRHHLVQDASVRAFMVDAVRFAVQLGVLLALALSGGEGFSAYSALYTLAVGGLAGCLAGLPRYGATGWSSRLARTVWPRHWNFIKWMTPGVLAETAQSHLPMIAATGFFGESALGLLRAVQSLANVLNLPLNALNQVLPVMASATYARNGVRELRKLVTSSMRVSTALYLLITCLCIAAFPYLTSMFRFDRGPDALIVFVMFSLANYARLVRVNHSVFFLATERPGLAFLENLVGTITSMAIVALAIAFDQFLLIPAAILLANAFAAACLPALMGRGTVECHNRASA